MKAFAICSPGFEDVAALEISELIKSAPRSHSDGVVGFQPNDLKDLCLLAYRAQSLSRVCYRIAEFEVSGSLGPTVNNLKKKLKNFKIEDWTDRNFVVECSRSGTHNFTSHDLSTAANDLISENSGTGFDFKTPQLRFYCHVHEKKGYFGVDVAGFDLSKREYRIFGHSSDMKATVAYSLVRLSGFRKGILLDPFSRSGSIAIEAALFSSNFPVNYHRRDSFSFLKLKPFSAIDFEGFFAAIDKKIRIGKRQVFTFSPSIAHVRSAEKNAKLAGINKTIKFARVDAEWLELKFDKGNVDCIVSYPPLLSKNADVSEIKKLYSEFFYQAEFILSEAGKIVLGAGDEPALTLAAGRRGFRLDSKREFSMGNDSKKALVFIRS